MRLSLRPSANFPRGRSDPVHTAALRAGGKVSLFSPLSIRSVSCLVGRHHGFVTLTPREQLVLAHDVLASMLHVVLVDAGENDRIHGAGLFAEAAVNALEQVDVVTRRPTRAIRRHVGIDSDAHGRAHRFTELASDAALFTVRIATLRV